MMTLLYTVVDGLSIAMIMWLFGASVVTHLRPIIEGSLMTAVLMREAVTISRIPDPPRLDNNIKPGE